MFVRILRESFRRQKRRKAIALAAVVIGTATATALANIALDIGDGVSRELRSFGANLVVRPAGGASRLVVGGEDLTGLREPEYLASDDILRVKQNFWKNNILDFAPFLDVPATADGVPVLMRGTWFERTIQVDASATDTTGARDLFPFWSVEGRWPVEPQGAAGGEEVAGETLAGEALAGRALAATLELSPGSVIQVSAGTGPRRLLVSGILTTGSEEDDAILAPLETVQDLAGLPGEMDRVLVSALTTPENAVYERLGRSPKDLPPEEFERWTCTPFVSSIAFELENAWPHTEARPIRRIADSEGMILGKVGGLMALIAIIAAIGSALTVTSTMTTAALERRGEIGLLKALGAGTAGVLGLFVSEAALIGLAGGVIGGMSGIVLSGWIRASVFGGAGSARPLALAVAIAVAMLISLVGVALPARRIAAMRAAEALRG